ncbi:sulfatase-like hydrolase/transferase [uncultured Winogradskyella sp.]|uniref:sulfatase-like hydrolase/transferase n=1 Tax=uncultured Winogradskyella sp. TaxID=395353 RepID=UPI002638569E|nr:sulfatase-like hydrolase/transferase [uncultured Winogradskyella sp.]
MIALLLGVLLGKHIKKLMVFQLFLAFIAFFLMTPKLYSSIFQSVEWMQQPDDIENVVFKMTPNIYLIQPDGYANFSELKKGHYKIDNSEFENYLSAKGFNLYNDYRSNYFSTISSNSSLFSMQHHYYNYMDQKRVESYKSRSIIAGNNPVIDIFKKNNYSTSLLLENEYLIVSRPEMNYDYNNILYSDMPYLSDGFQIERDLIVDIKAAMQLNSNSKNFYFIEKLSPAHIAQSRYDNLGKEGERLEYIENLKLANEWLKMMIETIEKQDGNGLIIIMGDHGGFVGMDSIYEAKIKQDDDELIKSVFTTALAVKWPNGQEPKGLEFKSSVNFFRNLFSYLSDEASYLEHLQEDASYLAIKKGAPLGVYKAIDKDNNVIFESITD